MRFDAERVVLLALLVLSAALVLTLGEGGLGVFVLVTLSAIVTVGVSLSMGHSGQVSLGQGAFYAWGAYAAGALATHGQPTLLGLVAAPLTAAALAVVVGFPLLLLRGHHLAFATLAVHIISLSLIGELSFAGGDVGLQGIPPLRVLGFELTSVRGYAALALALLVGIVLVTRNILASRPGRALRALGSSEVAAASSGIAVGRYKLAVFALSAAYAGLAGGVYAFYMGYLAPGSFPVLLSIEFVVMAEIGGLGRVAGALIGSATVYVFVYGLSRLATSSGMPSSAPVVLSYAVYALLLVVAVLFLPGGIFGLLERAWRRVSGPVSPRRQVASPARAAETEPIASAEPEVAEHGQRSLP